MSIRCCGGHDTVLSKMLYGRHPLGLIGSMWAATGAEKARREIKKARSFCLCTRRASNATTTPHTPLTPQPAATHGETAPIFSYYRKQKGEKEHSIVTTNGLKMSQTPNPFTAQHPEKHQLCTQSCHWGLRLVNHSVPNNKMDFGTSCETWWNVS